MAKLTKEQLQFINDKIERKHGELIKEREINSSSTNAFGQEYSVNPEKIQRTIDISIENIEYKKILEDLTNSEMIDESLSDRIKVGSIFYMVIDDRIKKAILLDSIVGAFNIKEYKNLEKITKNSPAGMAIFGKRENDQFCYEVNDQVFYGNIMEIVKEETLEKEKTKSLGAIK